MSAWSPKGKRCKHRRRGAIRFSFGAPRRCYAFCTRCGVNLTGTYDLVPHEPDERGRRVVEVGALHWRADQ